MLLALGMATSSTVGPLVLGRMTYRTSPTTLNQLLGSDAAALLVAVYTYAQVVIGQEYLRLPGDVERWFPLPAAILAGVGLWRHAAWARRIAYIVLTGYTLLAVSVTSMAILMIANDDPDASVALAVGFGCFALVFAALSRWRCTAG